MKKILEVYLQDILEKLQTRIPEKFFVWSSAGISGGIPINKDFRINTLNNNITNAIPEKKIRGNLWKRSWKKYLYEFLKKPLKDILKKNAAGCNTFWNNP